MHQALLHIEIAFLAKVNERNKQFERISNRHIQIRGIGIFPLIKSTTQNERYLHQREDLNQLFF